MGQATESIKLASSDASPYDPPHRKSQEKSSLGSAGNKGIIDGIFLSDGSGFNSSLHSLPNGRSSGSIDSRERGRPRDDGTIPLTNGIGNHVEKERQAPGPMNGVPKHPIEQVQVLGVENENVLDYRRPESFQSADSVHRHARAPTSSVIARHVAANPHSSQTETTSGSLDTGYSLPLSNNRFSSPASFVNSAASAVTPAASSTSSLHPGAVRLQHRHTLQVPRVSTASSSRDATNIASDAPDDGERSPTNIETRRISTNLMRRRTRSVSDQVHEVAPDEDMSRWTESVKQKRASRRHKKEEDDDDRVVVGTKVDMNHVNWVTAYNMLTGIRFTVSRTNAKIDRELTDADFDAKHKFSFDM